MLQSKQDMNLTRLEATEARGDEQDSIQTKDLVRVPKTKTSKI
jgi:hypothetical protein